MIAMERTASSNKPVSMDCAVFLATADPKLVAGAMEKIGIDKTGYQSPHDIFNICAIVYEAGQLRAKSKDEG